MRIIKLLVMTLSILSAVYFFILRLVLFPQDINNVNHNKRINNHLVKCVDNVSYLVGGTLTLKVDINNKPVPCDF